MKKTIHDRAFARRLALGARMGLGLSGPGGPGGPGGPASVPSYTSPLMLPGLDPWFNFTQDTTNDLGPNARTLTLVGSPTLSTMALDADPAYLLNGTSQYATLAGAVAARLQGPHYMWIVVELVANASGAKEIVGAYNSGASAQRHQIRWNAEVLQPTGTVGDIEAYFTLVRQGDTGAASTITTQGAVANTTLVLEVLYDGSTTRMWCNKMLLPTSGTAHPANAATFDRIAIGASFLGGVAAGFGNIKVAEFGIADHMPDAHRLSFCENYLWPRWIDRDEEMSAYMVTAGVRNNANAGGWRQNTHRSQRADGVKDGYEYAVNTDGNDYLVAAKRLPGARKWHVVRTLAGKTGAYLRAPTRTGSDKDNHNFASLGQLADGRIFVGSMTHAQPGCRTIAPSPGSIDLPALTVGPWVPGATNEDSLTYELFCYLPNGNIRRVWRQGDSGAADTILTTIDHNGNCSPFKNPIFNGLTNSVPEEVNIYTQKINIFQTGPSSWREYYFFTVRRTGVKETGHNKGFFCIDETGAVWKDPLCTVPQTEPVDNQNYTPILTVGEFSGVGELEGATHDENGVPMCVAMHCVTPAAGTPHESQYHVIRWNGSGWTDILFPVIETPVHDATDQTSGQVLAKDGKIHLLWTANSDGLPYVMRTTTADLGATFQTECLYAGQGDYRALLGVGNASAAQDERRFKEDDVFSIHVSYCNSNANLDGTRARAGIVEVGLVERAPQTLVGTGGTPTPWCALEEPCVLGTRGAVQWTDTSGNGRHFAPMSPSTIAQQPIRMRQAAPGKWPSMQGNGATTPRNFVRVGGASLSILYIFAFHLDTYVNARVIVAAQGVANCAIRTVTGGIFAICPINGTAGPIREIIPGRRYFCAAYFSGSANDRWWLGTESNITSGVSWGATAPTGFGIFSSSVGLAYSNSGVDFLYIFQGLNSTDAGNVVTAYKSAIAAKYAPTIPYSRNALII